MRRLSAIVLLASAACSSSQAEIPDCFSSDDCNSDTVCFFAKCVDPGFSIAVVHVDLTPAATSGLLPQLDFGSPRDLNDGLEQSFSLRATQLVEGELEDEDSDIPSGVVTATYDRDNSEPLLPSLQLTPAATVTSTSTGFDLFVVPYGNFTLKFSPDRKDELPPFTFGSFDLTTASPHLQYPGDSSLRRVRGQVLASAALQQGINDLRVSGRSSAGPSTVTTTANDGSYALVFPPGAANICIEVGPGANPQGVDAEFCALGATPNGDDLDMDPAHLDLPIQPVSINAVVKSRAGALVSNATLRFVGQVGVGTFSVTTASQANGSVEQNLPPGTYTVTVSPQPSQPYALTSSDLCVPDPAVMGDCAGQSLANPVELTVRDKVQLTGFVVDADNIPVSDAKVVLVARHDDTRREFTDTTAPDGRYSILVDPGNGEPVEYELTVEPRRESGLPRDRKLVMMDADDEIVDIVLPAASLVYGSISSPAGTALADTVIAIYSTEGLGTIDEPLLVGLGQSDRDGQFVIPIPTLPP